MLKYAIINADPNTRAGEILALLNTDLVRIKHEEGCIVIRGPHYVIEVMQGKQIHRKFDGAGYNHIFLEENVSYSDYCRYLIPAINEICIHGYRQVQGNELDGLLANFENSEEM